MIGAHGKSSVAAGFDELRLRARHDVRPLHLGVIAPIRG